MDTEGAGISEEGLEAAAVAMYALWYSPESWTTGSEHGFPIVDIYRNQACAAITAYLDASESELLTTRAALREAEKVVEAAWRYAMDDTPAVDHFARLDDLVAALRTYTAATDGAEG